MEERYESVTRQLKCIREKPNPSGTTPRPIYPVEYRGKHNCTRERAAPFNQGQLMPHANCGHPRSSLSEPCAIVHPLVFSNDIQRFSREPTKMGTEGCFRTIVPSRRSSALRRPKETPPWVRVCLKGRFQASPRAMPQKVKSHAGTGLRRGIKNSSKEENKTEKKNEKTRPAQNGDTRA